MKKKNLLMMALSLCMVAVIAVGGTLAYLTASDGALKNTFTFANNISVDLYETIGGVTEQSGHDFTNVVPGVAIDKDVNFKVTDTTVKTVVFVKIEAKPVVESGKTSVPMKLSEVGTELHPYNNSVDANGYGEYYAIVNVEDINKEKDIFAKVTAPTDANSTANVLSNIVISISAVQYDGLANVNYSTASEADIVAVAYSAKPAYQGVTTPATPVE